MYRTGDPPHRGAIRLTAGLTTLVGLAVAATAGDYPPPPGTYQSEPPVLPAPIEERQVIAAPPVEPTGQAAPTGFRMLPLPAPEEAPDSGPYDASRLFGSAPGGVPAAETADASGNAADPSASVGQRMPAAGPPAARFEEPVYEQVPGPQPLPTDPGFAPFGPPYQPYQPYSPQVPGFPRTGIAEPVYGGAPPRSGADFRGGGLAPEMPPYSDHPGYPSVGQAPVFQPRPAPAPGEPLVAPAFGPADDAVFRPQGL